MEEQLKENNRKLTEVAKTLRIELLDGKLPTGLGVVAAFTLIGGLSLIGGLFVDTASPTSEVNFEFYMVRLLLGVLALSTAYRLIKKDRRAIWLYAAITAIGLYFNPVTAIVPGLALIFLYTRRQLLQPSKLDRAFEEDLSKLVNKIKGFHQDQNQGQSLGQ